MSDDHNQAERNESAECFSPADLEREQTLRGEKTNCSSTAGWTSLLVQMWNIPVVCEACDHLPSPDQLISINIAGEHEIESFSGGVWRKALTRPGMGALTAAGKIDRLRWRAIRSEQNKMLFVYVPQFFLERAAAEFHRAGTRFRLDALDALSFTDPVICHTGLALYKALEAGAPNFYAESAAQFLATHLLSLHSEWSNRTSKVSNPGSIADKRLRRVIEFMQHHYADDLSLAALAREAGVSRFHFVNLFKKSCGSTPYRYLTGLRMNRAATLLEDGDLGIKEVAAKCGYNSPAYFAAAFQKHFAQSPAEYRKKIYDSESF